MSGIFTVADLMSGNDIKDNVQNYQDWLGTMDEAYTFAMFNNLGSVEADGDVKFDVNQTTGLPDDYTLTASLVIPQRTAAQVAANTAGDLSSSVLNLETILGITEFALRPGMAFQLIDGVKEGMIRIESGSTNAWYIRTIYAPSSVTAVTFTTASKCMLNDLANYADGAPKAQEFKPTRESNVMQLIDFAYGNEFIANSQNTKYDNSIIIQGREQMKRSHKVLNRSILFSTDYTDPGLGSQRNSMTKGLPGWLNLNGRNTDISGLADNLQANLKVDTGTTVDFRSLRNWAANFQMGGKNKLCVTSAGFSNDLIDAANSSGETVRTKTIEFPRFNAFVRQIDLGNIILNLIVDRNLDKATPYFNDGTNAAGHRKMLFAVDRSYFKLKYHLNKEMGLLTPTVRPVTQVNDERVTKMHILAGMGTSLWKRPAHGAYGIVGS